MEDQIHNTLIMLLKRRHNKPEFDKYIEQLKTLRDTNNYRFHKQLAITRQGDEDVLSPAIIDMIKDGDTENLFTQSMRSHPELFDITERAIGEGVVQDLSLKHWKGDRDLLSIDDAHSLNTFIRNHLPISEDDSDELKQHKKYKQYPPNEFINSITTHALVGKNPADYLFSNNPQSDKYTKMLSDSLRLSRDNIHVSSTPIPDLGSVQNDLYKLIDNKQITADSHPSLFKNIEPHSYLSLSRLPKDEVYDRLQISPEHKKLLDFSDIGNTYDSQYCREDNLEPHYDLKHKVKELGGAVPYSQLKALGYNLPAMGYKINSSKDVITPETVDNHINTLPKHNIKIENDVFQEEAQRPDMHNKHYVKKFTFNHDGVADVMSKHGKLLKDLSIENPIHPKAHGWVRYTLSKDNAINIEEIQTDLTPYKIKADLPRTSDNDIQEITSTMWGNNSPTHVIHQAFLQHMRDSGLEGVKVNTYDASTKDKIINGDSDKKPNNSLMRIYNQEPKRLGYQPDVHGSLDSHKEAPQLHGSPTWSKTLRKSINSKPLHEADGIVSTSVSAEPHYDLKHKVKELGGAVHYSQLKALGYNLPAMGYKINSSKDIITPETVDNFIKSIPESTLHNFGISNSIYKKTAQNHDIMKNNYVKQFNITPEKLSHIKNDKHLNSFFSKVMSSSIVNGHPVNPDRTTVGWVRYTPGEDGIHIDEIQSDYSKNNLHKIAYDEGYSPELVDELHGILWGTDNSNHVVHNAFLQHARDNGYDGTPVHVWQAESKKKLADLNKERATPVHMIETYDKHPKKMGYQEDMYGTISAQSNPMHRKKTTWSKTLRKSIISPTDLFVLMQTELTTHNIPQPAQVYQLTLSDVNKSFIDILTFNHIVTCLFISLIENGFSLDIPEHLEPIITNYMHNAKLDMNRNSMVGTFYNALWAILNNQTVFLSLMESKQQLQMDLLINKGNQIFNHNGSQSYVLFNSLDVTNSPLIYSSEEIIRTKNVNVLAVPISAIWCVVSGEFIVSNLGEQNIDVLFSFINTKDNFDFISKNINMLATIKESFAQLVNISPDRTVLCAFVDYFENSLLFSKLSSNSTNLDILKYVNQHGHDNKQDILISSLYPEFYQLVSDLKTNVNRLDIIVQIQDIIKAIDDMYRDIVSIGLLEFNLMDSYYNRGANSYCSAIDKLYPSPQDLLKFLQGQVEKGLLPSSVLQGESVYGTNIKKSAIVTEKKDSMNIFNIMSDYYKGVNEDFFILYNKYKEASPRFQKQLISIRSQTYAKISTFDYIKKVNGEYYIPLFVEINPIHKNLVKCYTNSFCSNVKPMYVNIQDIIVCYNFLPNIRHDKLQDLLLIVVTERTLLDGCDTNNVRKIAIDHTFK